MGGRRADLPALLAEADIIGASVVARPAAFAPYNLR